MVRLILSRQDNIQDQIEYSLDSGGTWTVLNTGSQWLTSPHFTVQFRVISTGGSLWSFVIEDHVESFVAKAWALQPRPFEDFPIPVLLLFVHGTHCDHTGVDPCVLAVIWHDSVGQFLVGKAFETIKD